MRFASICFAALGASSVAAACATGADTEETTTATTATSGTSSSSGAGGGDPDGGPPDAKPDVVIGCTTADDCAAFEEACSAGACVNGTCEKLPANEFGSCDDGLFCTENDVCQAGVCVGGTALFCPSLGSCFIGVCDEALQTCKNVPGNDGAQCEDDNPCTYAGTCNSGVCSQGPPVSCSVFDSQCTKGVCDPVLGCKAVPFNQGGPCDDGQGSPCSTGMCTDGQCGSIPTNEGGFCDDGLYCTIEDECSAGTCQGVPNTCAAPGDVCMVGSCNEATDTCVAVPGNNGAACDDGNDCTAGETCSAGTCVGGQPANEGGVCDDDEGCTAGTTCANGICTNATSTITTCGDGDACCPPGCDGLDGDCLYWEEGVQENVPQAALVGWELCHSDFYDGFSPLPTVLQSCNKPKLLMACRPTNSPTLTLVAMAPRADVLFDCGQQMNCANQANGVGWYYDEEWSWGFAPGGQPVNRFSCDFNEGNQSLPHLRMCWHTSGNSISGGYRCGNTTPFGSDWQRLVFEAD